MVPACMRKSATEGDSEAHDRKLRGIGSTLDATTPAGGGVASLQWPAPAIEMEASEKLAKDGLQEEEVQDTKGKGRAKSKPKEEV